MDVALAKAAKSGGRGDGSGIGFETTGEGFDKNGQLRPGQIGVGDQGL